MANEQRLIDAYALLEEIQFRRPVIDTETKIVADCVEIARKAIVNAPTVDAVEVVHGRWIYEEEPDENNNIQARCSVCFAGDLHATALMNKVPYCWKCGAKMDGDSNGSI